MTTPEKKKNVGTDNKDGNNCAVNSTFNFTVGIISIAVAILMAIFVYHHHFGN